MYSRKQDLEQETGRHLHQFDIISHEHRSVQRRHQHLSNRHTHPNARQAKETPSRGKAAYWADPPWTHPYWPNHRSIRHHVLPQPSYKDRAAIHAYPQQRTRHDRDAHWYTCSDISGHASGIPSTLQTHQPLIPPFRRHAILWEAEQSWIQQLVSDGVVQKEEEPAQHTGNHRDPYSGGCC